MEDFAHTQPDHQDTEPPKDSLLGMALSEAEAREKSTAQPFKIVSSILTGLRSRERDVLMSRYGLINSQAAKETLDSVGQRFKVTRERVRQIENSVLKKIGKKYVAQLKPVIKMINAYLSAHGGVAEVENLAHYLDLDQDKTKSELERRALRLIMGAYDKVIPLKKYPLFKEGWTLVKVSQEELLTVQDTIHRVLENAGQVMTEAALIAQVNQQLTNADPMLIKGTLQIDPKISLDRKGYWGLISWPLVVPKRIRDKVWLVLDETGKPLHFEKIAQLIGEKYPGGKPVLSRTVHNELIGDDRFVLVGRGIYALKKWGYKSGVVSDVIREVLIKAGRPLTVTEIVNLVLQSRQVKNNTIIANLQNRALFQKVAKSTYTLVSTHPVSSEAPATN